VAARPYASLTCLPRFAEIINSIERSHPLKFTLAHGQRSGLPMAARVRQCLHHRSASRCDVFAIDLFDGEARMAMLVAVYKTPKSAEAFDRYYSSTHVPLAKKIPGLRSYEVSSSPVGLPIDSGGVHLVALLEFDSADAIRAALASAEGQAAGGDLANFADGGVDLMVFDTKPA
jgi:uncharacterized protein (TIGR02118 family)